MKYFATYFFALVCSLTALRAEPISPQELAAVKAAEAARMQAIESVYGAVVAIYGNDRQGGGSGVLFDEAGYALTNHHVVAAAGIAGWAGLADGKLYRWRLIGTDPGGDVAVIQLQGKEKFLTAPLGDSSQVRVGDFSMAMGNPFVLAEDQRPTVTLGIVSGIERFQPGSGLNQLVYGNCIQVDSSINPGNSGGPLFNIRGQVIGINGRGSFEERGRVNVGLGYAISANQCQNFVPELLSTKIAQHGTLDAVFGTREGKVVCHTLNLDAPIARLGLQLGDQLLAFEGHKILNANQFTNLLSMLPAGWPCEVTFTREGSEPKTVYVRLTALPYESSRPAPMPGEEEPKPKEGEPQDGKPDDKPPSNEKRREDKSASDTEKSAEEGDKKDKEEEKADPKSKKPPDAPPGKIARPVRPPALPLEDAGAIRNAELNRTIAHEVVDRWRTAAKLIQPKEIAALRLSDEIYAEAKAGGELAGTIDSLLAADGRCKVVIEMQAMGRTRTEIGFDGKEFWQTVADESRPITQAKALRNPYFCQAFVFAQSLRPKPFEGLGKLQLSGSDKARGKPVYRVNWIDDASEEVYLWFSVFGNDGRPAIQLVKTGVALDQDDPIPSIVIDEWGEFSGIQLPTKRRVVRGLGEERTEILIRKSEEVLQDIPANSFSMPQL